MNLKGDVMNFQEAGPDRYFEALLTSLNNLEDWARSLPLTWMHAEHAVPGWGGPRAFHSFSSYAIALTILDHRAFSCLVLDCILTVLRKKPHLASRSTRNFQLDLARMATSVCACVPFFIGNKREGVPRGGTGCMQMALPLFICARSSFLPEDQRDWCISQLDFIGDVCGLALGYKLAAKARETKRKPMPVMTVPFRRLWKEQLVLASW